MHLENVEESASKEYSVGMSESESESETSDMHVDGWADVTMGARNPRHTHLLKMEGHNLTFYQRQSP
jgi:hypothetical protein